METEGSSWESRGEWGRDRVNWRWPGGGSRSRRRWQPGQVARPRAAPARPGPLPARCAYLGRRSGGGAGSGRPPPALPSRAGPGLRSWRPARRAGPGAQGAAGAGRRVPVRGALSRPGLCPGIWGEGVVARARARAGARAALGESRDQVTAPGAGGWGRIPLPSPPSLEGARPATITGTPRRHTLGVTHTGRHPPTTSPSPEPGPPGASLTGIHSHTGLLHASLGRGWGQGGHGPGPRARGTQIGGVSGCQCLRAAGGGSGGCAHSPGPGLGGGSPRVWMSLRVPLCVCTARVCGVCTCTRPRGMGVYYTCRYVACMCVRTRHCLRVYAVCVCVVCALHGRVCMSQVYVRVCTCVCVCVYLDMQVSKNTRSPSLPSTGDTPGPPAQRSPGAGRLRGWGAVGIGGLMGWGPAGMGG